MPTRLLVCAALLMTLAACRSRSGPEQPPPPAAAVVASFNFPESVLLAEIYAQALEHAGVPVRLQLNLGPRELVAPALAQGLVDVIPEYLGSALTSVSPDTRVSLHDPEAVRRALTQALSTRGLEVLEPAAASDANGVAVTEGTARRLNLHDVSDLTPLAGRLTFTGPAECPRRPYCLPGLHTRYGITFRTFIPLDTERQRITALQESIADAALLFTTEGLLASGEFVVLRDNRGLQPAENVVPVVSSRTLTHYGKRVSRALDAVSERLSQQDLVALNWRVGVAGKDPQAEARGWLIRQGLLPRA